MKIMCKMLLSVLGVLLVCSIHAQVQKSVPVDIPLNWHLLAYDSVTSVYGAEINRAYKFLEGKERKKKVVVAIIDAGCETTHEDLKDVLWRNAGELPGDGADNDGDGYRDDVHGWNFLGTADGEVITEMMPEEERVFLKKKGRMEELLNRKRDQREEGEYRSLQELAEKSELGKKFLEVCQARLVAECVVSFDAELKTRFPGEKIMPEMLSVLMETKPDDQFRAAVCMMYRMKWKARADMSWEELYEDRAALEKEARAEFERELGKRKDGRLLVGDDPENVRDRYYGNAVLVSEMTGHGTHVAGIIGARRNNGVGMDGVADFVELMVVRAIPDKGGEYDKDVALAIAYAVDHGADIINMSFGKQVSPREEWVFRAMRRAEKRGVLLVHGAGNSSKDRDAEVFYPSGQMKGRVLSNFIVVGASTPDGQPAVFSNYGRRSVDVFAPGVDIYSTYLGNSYRKLGGTSMSAPVVSGIAAMVMTYYPELSVQEVKDVIVRSARVCSGKQVVVPHDPRAVMSKRLAFFDELCAGGGIVSTWEAIRLADEMVKSRQKCFCLSP